MKSIYIPVVEKSFYVPSLPYYVPSSGSDSAWLMNMNKRSYHVTIGVRLIIIYELYDLIMHLTYVLCFFL